MMKKIISVCLFVFACLLVNAQNNLQFNRAVILRGDSVSTCSSGCADTILFQSFTVPQNKVLKIESINYIAGNYYLFLDRTPFTRTASNIPSTFPIWLPAGTYSIYFGTYNTTNSSSGQYAYLLSALEFNIIQ